MGCEIEVKARLDYVDVEKVKNRILELENVELLGKIDKTDLYWAKSECDPPVFRTRFENDESGERILITSKPSKVKTDGLECNVENEFEVSFSQKENIMEFIRGLNLVLCRKKTKKGTHYHVLRNNTAVHVEILEVGYLGYFLEMEICGSSVQDMGEEKCNGILLSLLDDLGVDRSSIEPKGYNRLLSDCGHLLG